MFDSFEVKKNNTQMQAIFSWTYLLHAKFAFRNQKHEKTFSNVHLTFSQEYKELFEGAGTNPGDKTLEDKFFEYEVRVMFKTMLTRV